MQRLGVQKWFFSSTSTGNMPFQEIKREIETVNDTSDGAAYPFLWITPKMLNESPDLNKYFFCRFYGIKLHGYYNGWKPNGKKLHRVFQIARERGLPVMIHTGGMNCCDAGKYQKICEKFYDVTVILAHGRPLAETVEVMNSAPNTYTDTAFMPIIDIKQLIEHKLTARILFGTDYPVTSYYYRTPARTYYRRRLAILQKRIEENIFQEIMSNFDKIVGNNNY
jgi:hypothetical protein